MVDESKGELLKDLKTKMRNDNALPLKKGATNLVFGEGNPETEIMFIGEGPGYWEDQKGRPFVGNAGAFLNQLLALAGLKREEVFITNVVHYRPPENRDPLPEELTAFAVYLDKMIDIINPPVIVSLGRYSMGKFLPSAKITSVHGKGFVVDWQGRQITVVPMYHPAAGLRNSFVKQQTMDDFRNLPKTLAGIKQKKEVEEVKKEDPKDRAEQMTLV